MRSRIGCEFLYQSPNPAPMVFTIRPRERDAHLLLQEQRIITPDVPVHIYTDGFGNICWRLVAPAGELRLTYDAVADHPSLPDPLSPDLPGTLVQDLPDDVMVYTLSSRYCQSDLVIQDAWNLFGKTEAGWARVQAICDWTHANVEYVAGSSYTGTSGYDAYYQRKGVCRDYAHIGVMLCRAVNIPARYCCGYLGEIGVPVDPAPMDFHAWFEAYVGGAWRTFDARYNAPRIGRIVVSRGRDAVDAALTTIYGFSLLTKFVVWANQVADDFVLAR